MLAIDTDPKVQRAVLGLSLGLALTALLAAGALHLYQVTPDKTRFIEQPPQLGVKGALFGRQRSTRGSNQTASSKDLRITIPDIA